MLVSWRSAGSEFQTEGSNLKKKHTFCAAQSDSMGNTVWLYHLQSVRDNVWIEVRDQAMKEEEC